MVADEDLQVVDLAVIGAIGGVGGHGFGFLPHGLEIVFHHAAAVAAGAEEGRAGDTVFRVRRGEDERVAELVERDLLLHRVGELAGDFRAGEIPLHFHAADALEDFFLGRDELGLLVAEVETVAQAQAGDAVLAVERRQGDVFAEGKLGEHDGQIDVVGPVEDSRAVGKGKRIGREQAAAADESWKCRPLSASR